MEPPKAPASPAAPAKRRAPSRFARARGRAIAWGERQISAHSKVGMSPLIERDYFPWAAALEHDWREVREELDGMMDHYEELPNIQDIAAYQYGLSRDDKWKSVFLFGYGKKNKWGCRRCPRTVALLDNVPGITTAFFSILGPGKHIPPHHGHYRGLVRYHLALKVPQDGSTCAIRVGDETVRWSEGAGFFFDDTYTHEAWNKSSEARAVLLLDVMRPLPFPYSLLNRVIIQAIARTPYVKSARASMEAWEQKFEQILAGK